MPLTHKVAFQGTLERCSNVQVSKLIRWRFEMEPDQVLKVGVNALDLGRGWHFFLHKKLHKTNPPHQSCFYALSLW